MARNEEARSWGAALLNDVVKRALDKGKYDSKLARMALAGAGHLDKVTQLARGIGYQLVIQPPEETENNWYPYGGKWKELVKAIVFHFYNAEDEELIAAGRTDELEKLNRESERRTKLKNMGLDFSTVTQWMTKSTVPPLESFCILALCEGFKIEWREVKK